MGQNWGQKLTKSERFFLKFVIILVFLKKILGGMGSPAPLFQHMWKLDNFLTFSYDSASFDHFQMLFCWSCYFQYLIHCLELLGENTKLLKSDLSLKSTVQWQHSVFLFSSTKWSVFNDTMICNILPKISHFTELVLILKVLTIKASN